MIHTFFLLIFDYILNKMVPCLNSCHLEVLLFLHLHTLTLSRYGFEHKILTTKSTQNITDQFNHHNLNLRERYGGERYTLLKQYSSGVDIL